MSHCAKACFRQIKAYVQQYQDVRCDAGTSSRSMYLRLCFTACLRPPSPADDSVVQYSFWQASHPASKLYLQVLSTGHVTVPSAVRAMHRKQRSCSWHSHGHALAHSPDSRGRQAHCSDYEMYANSKVKLFMLTAELQRRLHATGSTTDVFFVHPGKITLA